MTYSSGCPNITRRASEIPMQENAIDPNVEYSLKSLTTFSLHSSASYSYSPLYHNLWASTIYLSRYIYSIYL